MISRIFYFNLFLYLFFAEISTEKPDKLEKPEKRPVTVIIPTAVKRLDTVTLQCNYNLSGEPIYTVKWYKGSKEFYRYIPKELPNVQVFALPGITVDVS